MSSQAPQPLISDTVAKKWHCKICESSNLHTKLGKHIGSCHKSALRGEPNYPYKYFEECAGADCELHLQPSKGKWSSVPKDIFAQVTHVSLSVPKLVPKRP